MLAGSQVPLPYQQPNKALPLGSIVNQRQVIYSVRSQVLGAGGKPGSCWSGAQGKICGSKCGLKTHYIMVAGSS